jgi:hypothetical protein
MTPERPAKMAAVQTSIRETRRRLATQLTATADRVHVLFTTPSAVDTEGPVRGVVAGAVTAIAVAGHAKRVWTEATRTGLLRRAAIGGGIVAVAVLWAAMTRRR